MKQTKELDNIVKAINEYIEKHNGNAQVNFSACAFEGDDCNVVDDLVISHGFKPTLIIDLEEHLKELHKDKNEFISW